MFWWAAILILGTVAFGAGVVLTISRAANEDARLQEMQQIHEGLTAQAGRQARQVSAIIRMQVQETGGRDERERLFMQLAPHVDVGGIVTTEGGGISWVDRRIFPGAGRNAGVDAALAVSSMFDPEAAMPDEGSNLRVVDGNLVYLGFARLTDDRYLIGLDTRSIEGELTAPGMPLLSGMHVEHGSPESLPEHLAAFAMEDIATGESLHIVWEPARPGEMLAQRIGYAAIPPLAVTALLFVLVVTNTRRVARNLAESHARAESLAGQDPLSGLPNRLLFGQTLDLALQGLDDQIRAGEQEEGFALMFLDLDRFKEVNDAHGHQAGDALILQVAQRLQGLLERGDTLARFGGDEFAVLQNGVGCDEDARALAARILHALSEAFTIAGNRVNVGVSIGIALAPRDSCDRETLMRMADTALYEAKSEGRNRSAFFHREMDDALQMRKLVAEDLRRAIAENELTIHYQPIFSADGRNVVSLEALVRWPHPIKGMISPAKFVPLAEQSGLVIPLGEWVVRRVCEDGKRWPGVRIAVNVSPIQFRQRNFVEGVISVVEEAGFDPARLELELTEGVVVEDADAAETVMAR
ncbi:putative bifunctional diguanylate cyclase/phosphodiesterase, partial [Saliniramus sp.]|uniref:putative bifunctional diguanylate cyclase/phosphodiesterase n=1 Tax=Saliniramus sp. TaxID=2986772 RepID=UPI002D01861F